MESKTRPTATSRLGQWLPSDQDALEARLDELTRRVGAKGEEITPHPVIQEFHDLIERDPYHRWHSPVTGTITKAYVIGGTYYSEADAVGEDPAGPQDSQGYLTHVATRAMILIDCDDPTIGLMCALFVGMVEVSSCVIGPEIVPGHRVNKGDELGYFQYGGSTYCLIFRPGAIADISLAALPEPGNPDAPLVLMGAKIATAT